jgi:hypothetical protein
VHHQRQLQQPVHELGAVRRREHGVQRIALAHAASAGRGQQVQVVVAEHGGDAGAQRAHQSQRVQRGRAAVDQVAGQPQLVAVG